MTLVRNEQTKRFATALNNVAVALVVVGVVTPLTAISFEGPNAPPIKPGTILFAVIWPFAGLGLHSLARRALRSSKP